jgi:predicted kinase
MDKLVVVMMGAQGSGKTTYCREYLADCLRISQDEQGRGGHWRAFEEALRKGIAGVAIDRINALASQRKRYLDLARQHGYRTRIVWLNTNRHLCLRRCRKRTDHPTLPPEDANRAIHNFFDNLELPSRDEADELEILADCRCRGRDGASPSYNARKQSVPKGG